MSGEVGQLGGESNSLGGIPREKVGMSAKLLGQSPRPHTEKLTGKISANFRVVYIVACCIYWR
jgi:hypothetical protein